MEYDNKKNSNTSSSKQSFDKWFSANYTDIINIFHIYSKHMKDINSKYIEDTETFENFTDFLYHSTI